MSMPAPKLDNKLSVVGGARVQVTLLKSMIFSSCLNPFFIQRLHENICKVIMSVDIVKFNLPSPNVIPDEVKLNLNMLR